MELLAPLLLTLVAATPTAAPDLAAIDAFVARELERDRVPGLALVIVQGAQTVHARGFGTAGDGRPVAPQTPFPLGSMSKSFTALAILQLAEQGRVELDAPVQRYLPWFRVADPDASARITLRHLLHHTSGIPVRAPWARGPDPTLADHVRALADCPLRGPPGGEHHYASPNYQVLGAVVEAVAGVPFARHVEERIFTPLGMRSSFAAPEPARAAGLALGHQYLFGLPRPAELRFEGDRLPTASLVSSAEDLGRYLQAQLGAAKGIAPELRAQLHAPGAPGDGFSYAMGWRVGTIAKATAIHHGGILPNYRGKLVMLPASGYGVAVLTNVSSMLGAPTSHRVADGVAALLVGGKPRRAGLGPARLHLLAGLVLGLMLLGELRGAWRARRRPESSPLKALFGLGSALAIALGLPLAIGLGWTQMVRQLPDLGGGLLVVLLAGLGSGGYRLWRWGSARLSVPRAAVAPGCGPTPRRG